MRHRREDILELATYFLERHRVFRPVVLAVGVADALVAYDSPGNVRELERVIERAVALKSGDALQLDDAAALLDGYVEYLLPTLRYRDSMRAGGSRYAPPRARTLREQQAACVSSSSGSPIPRCD